MKTKNSSEAEHEDVYGASFALYDQKALLEFLEPFKVRFGANGISARDLFEGRRCLDAGCGNGRGSLFMLENGASHVTAVDISTTNIQSTSRNLRSFGFKNFDARLSSLESLSLDSESFDFVWCNGVLMHTANPDKCLAELARVLANGGKSWIYVYGANGIYWHFIRFFRSLLVDFPANKLIDVLRLLNYSTRFIGEYVDDWKTPYLRAYTDSVFTDSLTNAGFGEIRRLMGGMPYDTCARIDRFPDEKKWLGEGDLRYLLTKMGGLGGIGNQLSRFSIDEPPGDEDASVVEMFDPGLSQLRAANLDAIAQIAACANLQYFLREHVLSHADPINVGKLRDKLSEVLILLESAA